MCAVDCSSIHFLEVAVKLWLDENDAIEELLHHGLLILLVHCCNGLKLDVSLPIDGSLRNRYRSRMLIKDQCEEGCSSAGAHTDASNALNSSSLAVL